MNKKQKLIRPLDYLFFSIIFVMAACGIAGIKIQIWFAIIFLFCSAVLAIYFFQTIKMRIILNQKAELEKKATIEVEKLLNDGEKQVYYKVKQESLENIIEMELRQNYPKAKIFKNIYCPKSDGTTTEIDVLMISNDGIFIFEAKNISGRISGDWKEDKLIATFNNGNSFEIQNPILQNTNHFYHLKNLFGVEDNSIFKNMVVFGDATHFEITNSIPSYASICTTNSLIKRVKYKEEKTKNILSDNKVENYCQLITKYLLRNDEKEKSHIESIQRLKQNEQIE